MSISEHFSRWKGRTIQDVVEIPNWVVLLLDDGQEIHIPDPRDQFTDLRDHKESK